MCYVEEYDTQENWMIVEDAPNPDISRLEYSPDHALSQRGHISEQKFVISTARLIGFGYSFTSPSVASLIAAAEIADWDRARWPLSGALNQLGTESIHLRDAASLTVSFLERVYCESILDERRRAITVALILLKRMSRKNSSPSPSRGHDAGSLHPALPPY